MAKTISNTGDSKTDKKFSLKKLSYLATILATLVAIWGTCKSCFMNDSSGNTTVVVRQLKEDKTEKNTIVGIESNRQTIQQPKLNRHEGKPVYQRKKQSTDATQSPHVLNVADYLNETDTANNIAILIIDQNKNIENEIASALANIVSQAGKTATFSLFYPSFARSPFFDELRMSNARTISSFNLQKHADYVIIGQYSHTQNEGSRKFKYMSTAHIEIAIISCVQKRLIKILPVIENGEPYDDVGMAERNAKNKLIESLSREFEKLHI